MDITKCDSCLKNKEGTRAQKINHRFFTLCVDCIDNLGWTQSCLRSGTDFLLRKMPEKYKRVSKFSVTALNSGI